MDGRREGFICGGRGCLIGSALNACPVCGNAVRPPPPQTASAIPAGLVRGIGRDIEHERVVQIYCSRVPTAEDMRALHSLLANDTRPPPVPAAAGCICPPNAEETCRAVLCVRRSIDCRNMSVR